MKKRTQGVGVPYNVHRREDRATSRNHSVHDKNKPVTIVNNTFKDEVIKQRKATEEWLALYLAGCATKRKKDGSYYILGSA